MIRVKGQIQNGARCIVRVNGQEAGFIKNIDIQENKQQEEVATMGTVFVDEIILNAVRYSGSFSGVYLADQDLKQMGIEAPMQRDPQAYLNDVLSRRTTITVEDVATNTIRYTLEGVAVSNTSLSLAQGQSGTRSYQFMAERFFEASDNA